MALSLPVLPAAIFLSMYFDRRELSLLRARLARTSPVMSDEERKRLRDRVVGASAGDPGRHRGETRRKSWAPAGSTRPFFERLLDSEEGDQPIR